MSLLEILNSNYHLSDHSIRWCISRCSSWWLTAENNIWWSFLLSLNRNNFGNISLDNSSSISGWRLFTLNNFFSDPEPGAINILYGWSGICCQLKPLSFIFYFVTSTKLILFCIVLSNKYVVFFFFYILNPCLLHMHTFILNQFISFFYHYLKLK